MKYLMILGIILFVWSSAFAQSRSEKRGIAYGYHSGADMAAVSQGLSWWYNWHHLPDQGVANVYQDYDMEFVPMAWDENFNEQGLRNFLDSHPEVKYLLGFNEPNFLEQANMTPQQVADLWPKLEEIADEYDLELVGPAVNYCGGCVDIPDEENDSDPIAYLDAFFEACVDCRVDHIAVHTYMCYAGSVVDYIEMFKKYKKPIWLTEFACWDQDNITTEMQKSLVIGALDFLENDTLVYRYAWFHGGRNGEYPFIDLFDEESGKLTELGELYVNYDARHDTTVFIEIPARIEAEKYSKMSGVSLEATQDFDGYANVGWIDADDWLEYNIDVPAAGEYHIYLRASSLSGTSLQLLENGMDLGMVEISGTGGWQNWQTFHTSAELSEGENRLRVYAPSGGFNLNWIRISDHENALPVVNAGEDISITFPENQVSLAGSASDENSDVLSYRWTRASGPDVFEISNPSDLTTSVSNLQPGNYTFRLTVSDGFELVSDNVMVNVTRITGAEDKDKTFIAFPNPVKDILHLENLRTIDPVEIKVSDQSGRVLILQSVDIDQNTLNIDFSHFKKGLYILQVLGKKEQISWMIVK